MACPKRRKPKRDRRRVAVPSGQPAMTEEAIRETLVELKEKGLVEQDDQDRWKLTPEARAHEASANEVTKRLRLQSEHDRLTAEIADLDAQINNVDMSLMESHPDDDDLPLDERRFRVIRRNGQGEIVGDHEWRAPTPDATALRTFMLTEGLLEPDPEHPRRWRATPKALAWSKAQQTQYPRWYGAMEGSHGNG